MKHLSLRLAWHANGWNGKVCNNPKKNTYCIGNQSFPGSLIAENRDIEWESQEDVAGQPCSNFDCVMPCSNSINAFGLETIKNHSVPPAFFNKDAEIYKFDMPPATACVWPYEEMYNNNQEKYNYEIKLDNAKSFFKELEEDKTLVFYYANKSNPFSEDDNKVYVLVGVARLKKKGEIMYYNNLSEDVKDRYAGGFIWQLPITSHYPNEGFCIPYHKYMDNPEILNRLLYIPEQSNNFKYAAKHINDDDALIYIERLIEVVQYLIEIKDETENWETRKIWLEDLLSELWVNRGPYPGLAPLLTYLECHDLIPFLYAQRNEDLKAVSENIFSFFENRDYIIPNADIAQEKLKSYHRSWAIRLQSSKKKELAKLLTRISLSSDQIAQILNDERNQNGISSSISDIIDNLYILSEQYAGNNIGDELSFNKIDHAVLPSPELGLDNLCNKDDWRRLRALMVDVLKKETIHSFIDQETVISRINKRLSHYPDWKKEEFNAGFIDYDQNDIEKAVVLKKDSEDEVYVYLKEVYEDERIIENTIREIVSRPDVKLNKPYGAERWRNGGLFKSDSRLNKQAPDEYTKAIEGQIELCSQIFNKTCSVIAGSAGTGKTTIIEAIMKAIDYTSGKSESICLLAPTGKAADRIRQKTGREAQTIHSFLTENNWLNFNNWTCKREGGKKCDEYTTYIIDESSMIDLSLMATLFKAIDWDVTKRIILVGDPNQLPPIGRGKVFADVIAYIQENFVDSYGELQINIRQMENKVSNKGTGIIDLASLYQQDKARDIDFKSKKELLLKNIQESDEDVFPDLRIITWKDQEELESKLLEVIDNDMKEDDTTSMMQHQVISPYRGEFYGTENINSVIQFSRNNYNITKKGSLAGITVFDKVIQFTNRANSKAYYSYNMQSKAKSRVDVFNGELGQVRIHSFDLKDWQKKKYHKIKQFQVVFEQKPNDFIEFTSENDVENNIELGYAISVHKSQGSEFSHTYFILPKSKQSLLSKELLYTGITRAQTHLTILVEGDFTTLLSMTRPEKSRLALINSSVFEFKPLHNDLLSMNSWYEEGKIHSTLTEYFVRSKSEVIIANMLVENGFESIKYEEPLFADDGTFFLPDFTIQWKGKTYYWEHLGLLDKDEYRKRWEAKKKWYDKFFPDQLITTEEGSNLSVETKKILGQIKRNEI